MLELIYTPVRETKTCRVYQHGDKGSADLQTLYVKKDRLTEAGIPAGVPVKVIIKEAAEK